MNIKISLFGLIKRGRGPWNMKRLTGVGYEIFISKILWKWDVQLSPLDMLYGFR